MSAEAARQLEEVETIEEFNPEDEMFQEQIRMQKFEEDVRRVVSNSEIQKERKDENDILKDRISAFIGDSYEPFVFETSSGEFIVAQKKYSGKEKIDIEALAEATGFEKEDLRNPYEISILTRDGKITPDQIKGFRIKDEKISLSIKKVKKDPRKKERNKKK